MKRFFSLLLVALLLTGCSTNRSEGFVLETDAEAVEISSGEIRVPVIVKRQGGFTGAVRLEVSGVPDGVDSAFSPNPVSGKESTLTLRTDSVTGTYALSVRGTSGEKSAATDLTVLAGCSFAEVEIPEQPSVVAANAAAGSKPYAPGQVLVQYQPQFAEGSKLETNRLKHHLTAQSAAVQTKALRQLTREVAGDYTLGIVKPASAYRPSLLNLPQGESVDAAVERLERDPRIAYAEPNYYLELLGVPDDEFVDEEWHMLEFGLPQAWELETGTGDVVISIIDSGVDTEHEDLQGKLLPGCDFFDRDDNPAPDSTTNRAAHGTHVAGIAAAAGGNALGIAGVAYGGGVKLLPIKIFDRAGVRATTDNLIEAMLWSAGLPVENVGTNPHPADIINMSLGVAPDELGSKTIKSLDETAAQIRASGTLLFAASGNDNSGDEGASGVYFPASSPLVYSVGSVDSDGRRSPFSRYTPGEDQVDFMAPGGVQLDTGQSILSTYPDDTYGFQAGTSMAAPFVAGVAALLLSQDPDLTPDEVAARLTNSARFESYMTEEAYGVGIVCADRALGAATQCGE